MSKSKFLKRPLEALVITQYFGANKACLSKDGSKTIFCDGLNPPEGYRSIYSNMNGHNGLDLTAYHGMPLYASLEGIVEEVVDEPARGKGLGIVSEGKYYCDELERETQWKIRYWHLKSFKVKLGDKVKAGDLIGYCDNTGYSSGDHLHLEGKPVEYKKKKLVNILQNNGYYGAVNLLPYIESETYTPRPQPFVKNLKFGSVGEEVRRVQQFLKEQGFFPRNEKTTIYFGKLTKKAVEDFQYKYRDEILTPLELTKPTGVWSVRTRAKANSLL